MANFSDTLLLNLATIVLPKGGFVSTPRLDLHATDFTIAARVFLDNTKNRNILFGNWGSAGQSWQILFAINAGGTPQVSLRRDMITDGSNPEQGLLELVANTTLTEKAWYQIVFTWSWGGDHVHPTGTIYLNGKSVASQAPVPQAVKGIRNLYTLMPSSNPYLIGHKEDSDDDSSWFSGQIKDFRIYGSALSPTDLAALPAA